MRATPHLRLALALVALLLSTVLVADFLNLLPRPEQQIRESRKILGEALAIQLSGAVSNGGSQLIQPTLEEIVRRNDDIVYATLLRRDGLELASFGDPTSAGKPSSELSSDEDLVIPIYEGDVRWGEARLGFTRDSDWGWRYLGISSGTLALMGFLSAACLLTFYLFMRKALSELDPSKVVPRRVMAAFDVLAEGVLIIDERERIVLANRSFATRIGEEPESMVGKNPTRYDWDLKGDALEELPWQTVLKSGEHIVGMPLKIRVDGDQTAFTVNAAPIEDNDGARKGVLITFDDVTPLEAKNAELAKMLAELSVTHQIIEQKNEQLKTLATRDALTGCLNRRAFLESYQEHYSQAERKQAVLSVLMVDIDNFKRVNDQYGHIVGDHALKFVSDIIKDLFDRRGLVGRYGGEEFAVALPGVTLDEGVQGAEALRDAVSKRSRDGLPLELLTVSVGVASFAHGLKDSTELLDQADRALYKAKQAGRDRVRRYEPSDTVQVPRIVEPAAPTAPAEPAAQEEPTHTLDVSQLRARLRDMKKLIREQASDITHKSMHDELTGLPNRFLFQDRLAQAIRSSDRDDSITAVMCLSLSRYRETYDLVGYDAAEELIRQAAKRLESVVRKGDSGDLVYDKRAVTFSRIAENELAMLIVDLHTVESVTSVVSRLTGVLEKSFTIGANEVSNHVYCGVALYPHDSKDPDLLVRNASLARRYAERRSPHYSNSAYFSRDIDALAAKNAGIAAELRKAIREGSLAVAYQPKVDAVANKITGCEALARWSHPEIGDVSPEEFIGIAENIGLIHDLTDYVLSRVCDDLSTDALGGMRVSVNVSPLELYDPNTAGRLLRVIGDKGISPQQLEVEITESSILDNFELAKETLLTLQDAGLLVVLDDFGTAYSSLNLLVEIPVDVIKIDRSFVANVHNAPGNRAVAHAIIQMARAMGKRILAEGVETVDERDCLLTLGCREVQGFLYSKPLPLEGLKRLVVQLGVMDPSSPAMSGDYESPSWEVERVLVAGS